MEKFGQNIRVPGVQKLSDSVFHGGKNPKISFTGEFFERQGNF